MKLKCLLGISILLICLNHANLSASPLIANARAIGMGGAYLGLAEGSEAPGWNPANLVRQPKRKWSMNLLSLGVGINNNSFSKHQYDRYNGAYITKADFDNLVACIPDDGWEADLLGNGELLGLAYSHYAFTINAVAAGRAKIAKDLPALLPGNIVGQNYDIQQSDALVWAYLSYAFSAAFPIEIKPMKNFAVGTSLKLIHGLYCADLVNISGRLVTDEYYIRANANGAYQYAKGGLGISLDLGATGEINKDWKLGLAFNDLLSTINWNRHNKRVDFFIAPDSLNLERVTKISAKDSVFQVEDTTRSTSSFSTVLPAQMRIGAVYTQPDYVITIDYIQGFRHAPGVTTRPQLAAGIEYKPYPWLPLRTGVAVGGNEVLLIALGFGFQIQRVRIDFAVTNQGSILPGNRQGSTMAVGLRLLR